MNKSFYPIFFLFALLLEPETAISQEVQTFDRDSAFQILSLEQNPIKRAETFCYLGDSYFLTQTDSAIFFYNKAFENSKYSEDYFLLAGICTMLGEMYQYSDPTKAAEYSIMAVDYADKSENNDAIVAAHILLGNTHRGNNDLESAIKEYQSCLDIEESEGDSIGIARIYNNIGIVYMMSFKYDIGLEYWLQSLEIKLALGNLVSAASTMANIGLYYKDIERYEEANDYLQQALEINLKLKDYESIAFNYTVIGRMYQRKGESKKAIENLNLAVLYCDSNQVRFNKEEAFLGLAGSYSDLGNYKKAFEFAFELINLRRDLYDERNNEITRELTAKFESEKKQKELELLQSVNEAQEAKIVEEEANIALKEENNRYLVIGLILAGIAIISVFFVLFRVRRAKVEIEKQKHIVDEKNREITDSISYAKRLQDAILPTQDSLDKAISNNFVLYLPKDIVAGDFYWLENGPDEVLVAAADCTGHGVPGAMVSVVCHNALNRAFREFQLKSPAKILDKVTDLVIETFSKSSHKVKDGMDISVCSINFKTGQVSYAGANNSIYIVKNNSKELIELKADKQPVGAYENRKAFTEQTIQLETDDFIYLFTDGYPDQFGGDKGKKLKYKPFKKLLIEMTHKPVNIQKQELSDFIREWRGDNEQVDDICVIGIRM